MYLIAIKSKSIQKVMIIKINGLSYMQVLGVVFIESWVEATHTSVIIPQIIHSKMTD